MSPESQVFWHLSRQVFLSTVDQRSCTVVDVGPLLAASLPYSGSRSRRVAARSVRSDRRALGTRAACVGPRLQVFPVLSILGGNRCCVDVPFPDGPPVAPGADFGVCGPQSGPSVSARADFFGSLEIRFRRTTVTHRARKAIQGGDCYPLRKSLLRFPWLFPIRNHFELLGLHRCSYFGPRTCGRSINHFSSKCSGFLIWVSPSHP